MYPILMLKYPLVSLSSLIHLCASFPLFGFYETTSWYPNLSNFHYKTLSTQLTNGKTETAQTYLVCDDHVDAVLASEGEGAVLNNLVSTFLVQVFHGDNNLGAW